jgi:hypothetical protein
MEPEWVLNFLAAGAVYLLFAIARRTEKAATEAEAIRRMLAASLFPEDQSSDLVRIRSAVEKLYEWESEKRPRLGSGIG